MFLRYRTEGVDVPGWWRRPRDCRQTLALLHAYLDEEADTDSAWRVARHLSHCEPCFHDAETIRAIKSALERLRATPDPEALARIRVLVDLLTPPPPQS